jgi:hypothetical protein
MWLQLSLANLSLQAKIDSSQKSTKARRAGCFGKMIAQRTSVNRRYKKAMGFPSHAIATVPSVPYQDQISRGVRGAFEGHHKPAGMVSQ